MISQRLRQLRLARGLSLEALAAAIGGAVTKQALSKYEQGTARPSPVVLNRLAEALGVKAAYLLSEPDIEVQFIAYRKGSALAICVLMILRPPISTRSSSSAALTSAPAISSA